MKLRAVVVGLGKIGMLYDLGVKPEIVMTHCAAIKSHPQFELVAGVDVREDYCETFETQFNCKSYREVESAVESTNPDLVVIATPTQQHERVMQLVLEYSNPKAILCEKPLSLSLSEARTMVEACNTHGCDLFCNYPRRSDPGAIYVKRQIEDGSIHSPIKGVAWYSKGLLHNGSHFLNLLEYWLGELESLRIIEPGRSLGGDDIEPDLMIQFKRGSVTFLSLQEENYSHYEIELIAPNGRLRYERGGKAITWQGIAPSQVPEGYFYLNENKVEILNEMYRYQWNVMDQIAKRLMGYPAELCSGLDALNMFEKLSGLLDDKES